MLLSALVIRMLALVTASSFKALFLCGVALSSWTILVALVIDVAALHNGVLVELVIASLVISGALLPVWWSGSSLGIITGSHGVMTSFVTSDISGAPIHGSLAWIWMRSWVCGHAGAPFGMALVQVEFFLASLHSSTARIRVGASVLLTGTTLLVALVQVKLLSASIHSLHAFVFKLSHALTQTAHAFSWDALHHGFSSRSALTSWFLAS